MKVNFTIVRPADGEHADIYAAELTEQIRDAIDLLENGRGNLPCAKDTQVILLKTDEIYYMESVDKRTYVYTKDECFETKYRLYELEDMTGAHFFRCAKAMIVNLRKIRSVKAQFNGRMSAELLNGEQIVIARSYVKDLKRKLGL